MPEVSLASSEACPLPHLQTHLLPTAKGIQRHGGTVFLKAGAIFNTVALRDLPREVQAAADKGEQFEAVCKVGNLILWTMNLEDCVAPR